MDEADMEALRKITYLVGDQDRIARMQSVPAKSPFHDEIITFLDELSKKLLKMPEAKEYPDVITLGFWMRKASVLGLKARFIPETEDIILGRGVAFHIAPSNVPVNYAYSLLTGLLTGNANIVRVPSKEFPQVSIINQAIGDLLMDYPRIAPYICLVRYGREQDVNNLLSAIADTRIIWGGDHTIREIRKSPMAPRATEIAFADRYSLAVIDSDKYLALEHKERFAEGFYNDTFLTDQNACTSPQLVAWLGDSKEEAKAEFWGYLHETARKKYRLQPIMAVHKLTNSCLSAVTFNGVKTVTMGDNYITRIQVPEVGARLMEMRGYAGYFFEYDCENIMEIRDFCDNTHCQTMGFLGEKGQIWPLLASGIKGIDRVVPIGKAMEFDFIWDGHNLVERMTRTVRVDI